jgi:RNA polymerase sigma-70 factor (ECF subfamily)
MSNNDEPRLIEQARADPQAFAALYDRYVDRIYAYGLRQTGDRALAEDVTAATFEKALTHLRRYRWQGKPFVAWLYRIARNEAISQARRRRWLAPWQDRPSGGVERVALEQERHDALRAALARLSPADRELIGWRFFDELSSDEVAAIAGCSKETVYVRLHRALRRLRHLLSEEEGSESPLEVISHAQEER